MQLPLLLVLFRKEGQNGKKRRKRKNRAFTTLLSRNLKRKIDFNKGTLKIEGVTTLFILLKPGLLHSQVPSFTLNLNLPRRRESYISKPLFESDFNLNVTYINSFYLPSFKKNLFKHII